MSDNYACTTTVPDFPLLSIMQIIINPSKFSMCCSDRRITQLNQDAGSCCAIVCLWPVACSASTQQAALPLHPLTTKVALNKEQRTNLEHITERPIIYTKSVRTIGRHNLKLPAPFPEFWLFRKPAGVC